MKAIQARFDACLQSIFPLIHNLELLVTLIVRIRFAKENLIDGFPPYINTYKHMSSSVRSSLPHLFEGRLHVHTLCEHTGEPEKYLHKIFPLFGVTVTHELIRLNQVHFMQACFSGQNKNKVTVVGRGHVHFMHACMLACHSGQASDKPHALGVKFNLSKGFMRCILDSIFLISGIFLLAISPSEGATFTVGEAEV